MVSRDYIIEKIKSLSDEELEQVAKLLGFLDHKESRLELTESGMDNYLNQLSEYEKMLANGKIAWK